MEPLDDIVAAPVALALAVAVAVANIDGAVGGGRRDPRLPVCCIATFISDKMRFVDAATADALEANSVALPRWTPPPLVPLLL